MKSLKTISTSLLFLFVIAISASSAFAQCSQWSLAGRWFLASGPNTQRVINMTQSETVLNGTADVESGILTYDGKIENGSIVGNKLNMILVYADNTSGPSSLHTEVYEGTIGADGIIKGTVLRRKGEKWNWESLTKMKCLFKPVSKLGVHRTGDAPPTKAPPFITATSNGGGKYTLNWDGGKDHKYAEVWVKIGSKDETFVVEQGKGTRDVTVERGKTYVYILTDSGTTLATVTLKD